MSSLASCRRQYSLTDAEWALLELASCARTHGSAFLHPTAVVGERTIVMAGAWIGPGVKVGSDCVIGPGACVGQPGFGYERQPDGSLLYRPHLEGVVIGDGVDIGANTCIDQGRYRPTVIGDGTKIDNLVHVGHNVHVGRDCMIIALAMLGGSCVIGDRATVNPQASIRDHVTVGEDAIVGMGAVVVKDVPAGEVWVGNPARFLRRVDEPGNPKWS